MNINISVPERAAPAALDELMEALQGSLQGFASKHPDLIMTPKVTLEPSEVGNRDGGDSLTLDSLTLKRHPSGLGYVLHHSLSRQELSDSDENDKALEQNMQITVTLDATAVVLEYVHQERVAWVAMRAQDGLLLAQVTTLDAEDVEVVLTDVPSGA